MHRKSEGHSGTFCKTSVMQLIEAVKLVVLKRPLWMRFG